MEYRWQTAAATRAQVLPKPKRHGARRAHIRRGRSAQLSTMPGSWRSRGREAGADGTPDTNGREREPREGMARIRRADGRERARARRSSEAHRGPGLSAAPVDVCSASIWTVAGCPGRARSWHAAVAERCDRAHIKLAGGSRCLAELAGSARAEGALNSGPTLVRLGLALPRPPGELSRLPPLSKRPSSCHAPIASSRRPPLPSCTRP